MRRKWPVLTAAIPLAFGWALVAAHPVAAAVRDGSPSNWAGYAATGASGSFTSVSASWTQPTASCAAQWFGV